MTIGAFRGRELVENYGFVADGSRLRVASVARNVGMASRQRKRRALIMVEGGRRPAHSGVTIRAARLAVLGELPRVNVGMTLLAIFRRALERDFANPGSSLMAGTAGHGTVGANQWKIGFRVIEAFCVDPRLHAMASLATHGRAVGSAQRHLSIELTVMRIGVAGDTTSILEIEWQCLIETRADNFFVTLDARHNGMSAFERKARFLVHGNRKSRSVKIAHRVAAFATVLVGGLGKLPFMDILVAIEALVELDLINRIRPGWNMALRALHAGMFSQERIDGARVFFYPE